MSVIHGGLDERELRALGIDPASVIDLSANLHPAGPSDGVLDAARSARFDRYPSAGAIPLREAIARHEGVPTASVLPTPGATAAIHLLARALLRPGDRAAILEPTFGEYRAAIEAAGGCVEAVSMEPPSFAPPSTLPEATLAFVANPNNPTGACLERREVERWLSPSRLLVIDAAYEAFVQGGWDAVDLVRDGANVAVVRSMTKLHAIPGIRLGYVVASPEVIVRLERLQPSWSLDAVAQAVGPVALAEHPRRVEQLTATWAIRDRLRAALEGAGLELGPSRANFLLVRVGDGAGVRSALLRRGVLVRDCGSFGLPEWIRVAVPRVEDEGRVRDVLLAVLGPR
ncbi:MAG: histidinol-phosphate aminotransferase family protein [Dehalococcoidia bacterium]|nr:histidinol-phosphate aminotransferase family protein [Dehalococcoidia bacterium]